MTLTFFPDIKDHTFEDMPKGDYKWYMRFNIGERMIYTYLVAEDSTVYLTHMSPISSGLLCIGEGWVKI